MPRLSRIPPLLSVLALAAACGGGGEPATTEPPDPGQIAFSITRSPTSQVPAAADSALVRVWNPGTGFNKVWPVAIPAPGTTTDMDLAVPAGAAYRVGVLAYTAPQAGFRHALAAGVTNDVTVSPGAATAVALTVAPWTFTITGPATAESGEQVTYTLNVTSGPVDDVFSAIGKLNLGLAPDVTTADYNLLGSATSMPATFNVPTVAADTAMYFRFALYVDQSAWQSSVISFTTDMPAVETGEAPFRVPVTVPGGTITVTF